MQQTEMNRLMEAVEERLNEKRVKKTGTDERNRIPVQEGFGIQSEVVLIAYY